MVQCGDRRTQRVGVPVTANEPDSGARVQSACPEGEFELHPLSAAYELRNLGSRQEGLSPMEAAERPRTYGPNRVQRFTLCLAPGLGVASSRGDIMEIFPRPRRRPLMGRPLALRNYRHNRGRCSNGILFRADSGRLAL